MTRKIYVGGMPPPYGGISVYLYRLNKIESDSLFIDTNRINKIWFLKQFITSGNYYIFNSSNIKIYFYTLLLKMTTSNKYAIHIHGNHLTNIFGGKYWFYKYLIKLSLKFAEEIYVVNANIRNYLIKIGINPSKISIKYAFLPPPLEDEEKILKTYPSSLFYFIDSHKPLLIANAFKIFFRKGVDVYGLDMCIELTSKLKENYPKIGFIFALPDVSEKKDYQERMKKRIKELNIEDNFYFLVGQKELWPLFKRANLMLRPTYIDGDSVSIREAIFFTIPTIASDFCERPKNTILFKNRDINDLYITALDVIKNGRKYTKSMKNNFKIFR